MLADSTAQPSGTSKIKRLRPAVQRTAISTSRELDFFSRKELVAQVGHEPADWPLVVVKELIDNALDACEEARVEGASVCVNIDDRGITVTDNGPGLPPETIASVCDFTVRVSSREAYVAPDRGAQGNALKTLLAMPFVLSGGDEGCVEITSSGHRHSISVRADRIAQRPEVDVESNTASTAAGTAVTIFWPGADSASGISPDDTAQFLQEGDDDKVLDDDSACSILVAAKSRILQIVEDFSFLNPHASFTVSWFGERHEHNATDVGWRKWLPSNPTSVHWYEAEHFGRLVAGYIAHDRERGVDRTVREFVAEFDGLTGTAKQKSVLEKTGLARSPLSTLAADRDLDADSVGRLHRAMMEVTKAVKPRRLGLVGKKHVEAKFASLGAEMNESFSYKKAEGVTDGLPWLVETAFAWRPEHGATRRLVTGVNWSPGILNPFRRLGRYGASLDGILAAQRAGSDEPVVLLLHMSCPRVEYTDRGKSAVVTR